MNDNPERRQCPKAKWQNAAFYASVADSSSTASALPFEKVDTDCPPECPGARLVAATIFGRKLPQIFDTLECGRPDRLGANT